MKTYPLASLAIAALVSIGVPSVIAAPQIIQASDPVRPDETVLVTGEGFGNDSKAELAVMPDRPGAEPQKWEEIKPLQCENQSLKFVVPKAWKQGVWMCRVKQGGFASKPVVLNAPSAWWWNGDEGETATPGGWLRVFGKSLNFGGKTQVKLQSPDGKGQPLILTDNKATPYALSFTLPANLAPGDYPLFVNNGLGGEAAWTNAGTVNVRTKEVWKSEVFNVKDFGPDPAKALLAALDKAKTNGGGIVYVPRGRYQVATTLTIPPHTILRGESMETVSLSWPDYDKPPVDLLTGSDYGIENITLYCMTHQNFVTDQHKSQRFFVRHVRIRADSYFRMQTPGVPFRERKGPANTDDIGAGVLIRGKNFDVTDCDIYDNGYCVRGLMGKVGIIARNKMHYGACGYGIENTERCIFEDNEVLGSSLTSAGNGFSTFWSTRSWHVYFAHNHILQIYGADREMMTLDSGGSAYVGKLASVNGTQLTLANDMNPHDYTPKPRTDWTDGVVQIMKGKGAGQYRFVVSDKDRDWHVDRPWDVDPDKDSLVSITAFRGLCLYIENTFEDGGACQLYAAAHDSIVAGNKGSRMDGFAVWGINPHGWGLQPSWNCQFLDNEILEGNCYGMSSGGFGTIAYDETKQKEPAKAYTDPLVSGTIFRRNICHNNSGFGVGGALTSDTIVEHCTVRNNEYGVQVAPLSKGVLLRDNTYQDVAKPEVFK